MTDIVDLKEYIEYRKGTVYSGSFELLMNYLANQKFNEDLDVSFVIAPLWEETARQNESQITAWVTDKRKDTTMFMSVIGEINISSTKENCPIVSYAEKTLQEMMNKIIFVHRLLYI